MEMTEHVPDLRVCLRVRALWARLVLVLSEDPLYTSVTHENMNRIYEERSSDSIRLTHST